MSVEKKAKVSKLKSFFKTLGPGLITGASDDDPSGIATYSQAGAQFGLATLWSALVTFPLMYAVQEMCGRIGLVTSKGLIKNIKENYSPYILILTLLITAPAIVLNIGADIAGMGAVSHLIFSKIPAYVFSILFTIFLAITIINVSYEKIFNILKYFCFSLFLYLIIPFLIKIDWLNVIKNTFVPAIKFNKEYLNILVAILGTTISPYLFFWQSRMEAEAINQKSIRNNKSQKANLKEMFIDIGAGMFFSNLVMYFIILTTASVLFSHGITHIDTVEQAAKALEPIAGKMCYLLFASGVIGTGLLAIPVFCSCLAYIVSDAFGFKGGLNKKFHQAKIFYTTILLALIIGLAINALGISPITVLIYTAVLYGVSAPPILILIFLIANNKKIMGDNRNSLLSNILVLITILLMSVAAILLLYFQFSGVH
jgi:NRAMP (natural resistance-associated macrophage protein)-like metal ion transporter